VVCGSGGVGKTTTAAALGLRAALDGRRVLVCTIDPSRRLATSLGLQSLSGRPRALDIGAFSPARGGALFAMTLDTKGTFDALVERYARDEAARKRILGNRFYREVSAALSGSHEYMAMEKLLELAADDRYDLVVLDTPPTRHALDFLEAPERLLSFLDSSVLRFFLRPYFVAGRLTLKVATRTGAIALKLADRFLGLQFLQDLSEFFLAFESMYDGFKERAEKVFALLRDETSGFVLVAGPSGAVLDEALYFHGRLKEKRMPFVAFVVNRIHPLEAAKGRAARGRLPDLPRDFQARLLDVHEDYRLLRRAEAKVVDRLEVDAGEAPILVAEREADVHDLRGLHDVASSLLPL
jgi:anion-transporting  ArsA/GET3 family ATPase